MNSNQISSILLMLTLATLLTSCEQGPPMSKQTEVVRPAKIFVVTEPSKSSFRSFPAEVEANDQSHLAFRVSGQVAEFPVKAGFDVEKGQLLARLDPADFKLKLDEQQARFDLAHSKFERFKSLLDKKLTSQSNYDEALANLNVARSALNAAKSDLNYTYLKAPFSGTISRVSVENHENVVAKQTVLTMQSSDVIDISIQIPESIVSHVKKDTSYQPTVQFDSIKGHEFLISVKEWDSEADPSTLTYKVVFSLPRPQAFNVLPGMSARVKIDLARITDFKANKFLLPIEAVFSAEDQPLKTQKKFVWKVSRDTSKVSRVEVSIGEIRSDGIEVIEGVETGDQIVAAGVHFLKDGMSVRPWNREGGL